MFSTAYAANTAAHWEDIKNMFSLVFNRVVRFLTTSPPASLGI